jgi:UDP-GlcNAc3NAcA epimerase
MANSKLIRVLTIVGARPQFIKAAAISRVIRLRSDLGISETLIHTGQHHDKEMSQVFFDELEIPRPKYNLGVNGGSHGEMTGRMLQAIEVAILNERPQCVLVYGDTNSTLAGALAAAKLRIPVAHVEAGLRSFNRGMPEEVNRVVTDTLSTFLFCPSNLAVANLRSEGITRGVHFTGDVMFDAVLHCLAQDAIDEEAAEGRPQVLVTCHRAENTDDVTKLEQIFQAVSALARHYRIIFPLHPRTRKAAETSGLLALIHECEVTNPLPYAAMLRAQQRAAVVLTDSGGMQKEAFFVGTPCVTVRDETEWPETIEAGMNVLVPTHAQAIVDAVRLAAGAKKGMSRSPDLAPYGDAGSSHRIAEVLSQAFR